MTVIKLDTKIIQTALVVIRRWDENSVLSFDNFKTYTINDNDMLPYSLTTMMCFLTKEWYGFPAYTVNLFIKAYHKITYKEDL